MEALRTDAEDDVAPLASVTGALAAGTLVSVVYAISAFGQYVGGILAGSLALLADAGHMLTDAVALALAYAAFRFGRRAADSKRTFGYLRFEVIAGFLNAVTLFAIVAWIAYEAWERLQAPPVILGIAALLGVIALCGTVDLVSAGVAVIAGIGAAFCLILWAVARYIREGK